MKKILVVIIIMVAIAIIAAAIPGYAILSAAEAEDLRCGFVASIDDKIITFVDASGLCWEWESKDDNIAIEVDYFDLYCFYLTPAGNKGIRDDEMSQPQYSGIRVDQEWAIRVISNNCPELLDHIEY
jgi:hypothetical protein